MNILHIIDKLSLGGPQTLLKEIIEEQVEKNRIILYALRETDIIVNIKHHEVNIYPSSSIFSVKPLKELNRIIENENIEILHCHGNRSKYFGWILKKRFNESVKLVFHEHGDIFRNNKIYDLLLRLSIPKVDLYIAVSKATKVHLVGKARIPENKIEVLYNFVNLKKYNLKNSIWNTEEERRKINLCKEDFVIGFAGRLIERKGWRTYLNAAELASHDFPNAKFLIAGDGRDKIKLLRLIDRKHLCKNTTYIGYISDMTWFYSLLDCFVIPSYYEPMGLTEIEAQAMGVPVISSNVEALNEIIFDRINGLLFEPKNEKELAEKIALLFEDDNLRQRIISDGLRTVQKYSLDEYIDKLNRTYGNLF